MTDLAERPKGQGRFTEAEVQRGLIALVAANGNSRKAAAALAEDDDGFTVEQSTLHNWKTKKCPEEYQRIRAELLPKIREQQADAHRELERRQLEVSAQAADLIKARLPKMENKDLINAMGKADIGSGIHGEKALLHDGQPTHIVAKSSKDLIRELEAEGLKLDAIDAEIVSEEDVTPAVGSGNA